MHATDVIAKKRDGGELSREEIEFFVQGYTQNEIPDYQAAAFLSEDCLEFPRRNCA